MTTRRPGSRRAFRPHSEVLEGRQLLSGVVTGTDTDGDKWVLRLLGPGILDVRDKNGNHPNGSTPFTIDTISLYGTDSRTSRLIGTVQKAPGGDGKVFFRDLQEFGSRNRQSLDTNVYLNQAQPIAGNGLNAIDMPGFWLGNTDPSGASLRNANVNDFSTLAQLPVSAGIFIQDGVGTLRFGGVDTTYVPAGGTASTTSDLYEVDCALPFSYGTSIIIDKSISSAQASTSTTSTNAIQHAVAFNVSGRLNLFQANSIEGNASLPSSVFPGSTDKGTIGGTAVVCGNGAAPLIAASDTSGVTGQIGNLRIGGNATNFATYVYDNTGTGGAKISNYSIGGETDHVLVLAPNGMRNVNFGLGMDTVTINAQTIANLNANRGAISSDVTVDRSINRMMLGGDVVDTNVLAGYRQDLATYVANARRSGTAPATISNRLPAETTPFTPPSMPLAQNGGHMKVLVAGNIQNSVFAASDQAHPLYDGSTSSNQSGTFDVTPGNNIFMDNGAITAKVEGSIDNKNNPLVSQTNNTNQSTAFFSQTVHLAKGPVIPPNVPEQPYPHLGAAPRGPRISKHLQPTSATEQAAIAAHVATSVARTNKSTAN